MDPLTRGQAMAGRVGKLKDTDREKDHLLEQADAQKVEIDGRRQYFSLQKAWSITIIAWISGLLLCNFLLVVFIGAGVLTYEKTPWLITSFVTEIFLQVIGLGYIAARFLFPGIGKAEAPKPATRKAPRSSPKTSSD